MDSRRYRDSSHLPFILTRMRGRGTGVAFDKMRRPGTQRHAQNAGVENVSRSFHAHREPQQSTRFGPSRDSSFSWSKDGTFLMRLFFSLVYEFAVNVRSRML
jgi:hypothetical protein